MKIIVRKKDKVVTYCGDYELTKNGLIGKKIFDPNTTTEKYDEFDVEFVPDKWKTNEWKYENNMWLKNDKANFIDIRRNKKRKVPTQISRLKAILYLTKHNLNNIVEQKISSMDLMSQIIWKEASVFERESPFLNKVARELNISSEQLDQMFIEADDYRV